MLLQTTGSSLSMMVTCRSRSPEDAIPWDQRLHKLAIRNSLTDQRSPVLGNRTGWSPEILLHEWIVYLHMRICTHTHIYTQTHTHKLLMSGQEKMAYVISLIQFPAHQSWLGGKQKKSKPPSNNLHYKEVPATQDGTMRPLSKDCSQHLWSLT